VRQGRLHLSAPRRRCIGWTYPTGHCLHGGLVSVAGHAWSNGSQHVQANMGMREAQMALRVSASHAWLCYHRNRWVQGGKVEGGRKPDNRDNPKSTLHPPTARRLDAAKRSSALAIAKQRPRRERRTGAGAAGGGRRRGAWPEPCDPVMHTHHAGNTSTTAPIRGDGEGAAVRPTFPLQ
jgi:hypothetical protein